MSDTRTPSGDSIVKKGGIGSDADAEDVSRDTYGFTESEPATDGLTPEQARQRFEQILPDEAVEQVPERSPGSRPDTPD
jgi:hypothetical protein